jgi:hypothetical protein
MTSTFQPLSSRSGVHREEVAGEERRLVAAGAGANFEDGALLVRRVLRQEHQAQFACGLLDLLLRERPLLFREAAHLRIHGGIVDHGLEAAEVLELRLIGTDRADHGIELRELAGEGHKGFGFRPGIQGRGDDVVARQDGVQAFGGGSDGHGQSGIWCFSAKRARAGLKVAPLPARSSSVRTRSAALPASSASRAALTGPIEAGDMESERKPSARALAPQRPDRRTSADVTGHRRAACSIT